MHDSDVLDRFETELADVIEDILNRHGHAELFTDAYCEPCFDLVIAATHVGLSTETSAPDGFVQWPSSKSMTIEPGEIRVKCGYFGQYSTFWTA